MACKRNQSSREVDFLHLPDFLLDNIMTRLSLHNAGRTSVLSKAWRYKWTSLSQLVFDGEFYNESTRKTQSGFLLTIFQVLLLHQGPIKKFVLAIPGIVARPEIDHFILFLSKHGVKNLELLIWEGQRRYKLPSSLFACIELERLELRKCLIKPPVAFKGFNKLRCLQISDFDMAAEVFSGLISNCPLLEELTAETSITIKDCVEIAAVNLKMLQFIGKFASILLKNTPNLAKCIFRLEDDEYIGDAEASNVFQSLDCLTSVEYLDLNYYYVAYKTVGNVPYEIRTYFNQLRVLHLWRIKFGYVREISNVICLLRSSPNLEALEIEVYTSEYDEDEVDHVCEIFSVQEQSNFSLGQVREVKIHCISDMRPELAFVKLLLGVSPKLEMMTIWPEKDATEEKRYEILTEVTSFCRLSPLAKIDFKNHDIEQVAKEDGTREPK